MSMLNETSSATALTNVELMNRIPMAFADGPTAPMSERYVFIPTTTLVEDMRKMGWNPVLATGKGKRRNSKRKSSYHLIAFENEGDAYQIGTYGYKVAEELNDEAKVVEMENFPTMVDKNSPDHIKVDGELYEKFFNLEAKVRLIITNSHDGTSSFGFHIGIFRIICENGLVVSTKTFTEIKVRHIHYTFEELRKVVATATEAIPHEIEAFNAMKNRKLNEAERNELAVNAIKVRKGMELSEPIKVDDETISDLLEPKREEDNGNDLWSVYNVLQEKVIKGGAVLSVDGKKPRKMRGIKSAIKDLAINKRLFELAYSYVGEAEAA